MISRGAESKAIAVSFVGACSLGLNAVAGGMSHESRTLER